MEQSLISPNFLRAKTAAPSLLPLTAQRPGTHFSPLRPLASTHSSAASATSMSSSDPFHPQSEEDKNGVVSVKEQQRTRIVQNLITYFRFYCGQVRHLFSLDDLEDLIAHPVVLSLDMQETHRDVWEMLEYVSLCCARAQIRPVQWFDILSHWKPKFSRVLTFAEFSLGLARLFEEVNAQALSEEETQRLFRFFLRHTHTQTLAKILTHTHSETNPAANAHNEADVEELYLFLRRRDFQVGFKKRSLSRRRVSWLNHQAQILSQCQSFLSRLRMRFRDLSLSVVRSKGRRQRVNALELQHLISVLVSDYVAFANCSHVDALLQRDDAQKRARDKAAQQQAQRARAVEEEEQRRSRHAQRRRTMEDSEGTIEIFDDAHDSPSLLSHTHIYNHHHHSPLDAGDDMSTFSLLDDMSEVSSVASSSSATALPHTHSHTHTHTHAPLVLPLPHHMTSPSTSTKHRTRVPLFIDTNANAHPPRNTDGLTPKNAHTPIHRVKQTPKNSTTRTHTPTQTQSQTQSNTALNANAKKLRSRRSMVPIDFNSIQKTDSEENLDMNERFMSHFSPEEAEQLQKLVSNLKIGKNEQVESEDAPRLTGIKEMQHYDSDSDSDDAPSASSPSHPPLSFIEESTQRSSALVRGHTILQKYTEQSSKGGHNHHPGNHQNGNNQRGKEMDHHRTGRDSDSPLIPKEVVDDWFLHDQHFQRAAQLDPQLTPAAFKEEYQAFESTMKKKRSKHMQYFKSITDHFDRRVEQTQKRLARARKTGL